VNCGNITVTLLTKNGSQSIDSSKKPVGAIVGGIGVGATATVGRVGAKGTQRTGIKARGKYECEAVRGHELMYQGS
jgi:hypothetical protein